MLVSYKRESNTPLFFTDLHIEAINLLRRFEIKLPSTSEGDIAGIFLLQWMQFNIAKLVFEAVLKSSHLVVIFSI